MLVLAGGCRDQRAVPAAEERELGIVQETWGLDGPYRRPVRLVVYREEDLLAARLGRLEVDFSTQMVLLAGLGSIGDRPYQVRIARVRERGAEVEVDVEILREEPGLGEGEGEDGGGGRAVRRRSPWHAVVVPRSEGRVRGFSSNVGEALQRGHNPFR